MVRALLRQAARIGTMSALSYTPFRRRTGGSGGKTAKSNFTRQIFLGLPSSHLTGALRVIVSGSILLRSLNMRVTALAKD